MCDSYKSKDSAIKIVKTVTPLFNASREPTPRYDCQFVQFDNGLRLCLVPFPGIKTVSIRSFVFVGSVYESPDLNGISHFLEHMLFRGNSKLGNAVSLSRKMEELGGEFNAATSFDMTEYWLDFHKDYLQLGLTRFCHFLQYPLFEQIEVERSIILEEIKVDYNEDNNLIDLDSLTSKLLWPNHPMGMPIIGNETTISGVSREDLIKWHQEYYQPGNIVLGITGDFEFNEVIDLIEQQFQAGRSQSDSKRYTAITKHTKKRTPLQLVQDQDNQFGFQWSFPCYRLSKELKVEYELIRRILDDGNSSRLQRLIREEKGLVYDISLDNTYFAEGVVMSLQSLVGINRLEELIIALVELIGSLIAEGIDEEELSLAKLRYRSALECNNDSAQGILYSLLTPILYPASGTFEEVLLLMEQITTDRINKTLRTLLDQGLTSFVLVGPWRDADKAMLTDKLSHWIKGRNIS
ncbi:insulinase family protein [bacterium]|nr:insulinase family protein [bacterium]